MKSFTIQVSDFSSATQKRYFVLCCSVLVLIYSTSLMFFFSSKPPFLTFPVSPFFLRKTFSHAMSSLPTWLVYSISSWFTLSLPPYNFLTSHMVLSSAVLDSGNAVGGGLEYGRLLRKLLIFGRAFGQGRRNIE